MTFGTTLVLFIGVYAALRCSDILILIFILLISKRKTFMINQLLEQVEGGKHCAVYLLFALLCFFWCFYYIHAA